VLRCLLVIAAAPILLVDRAGAHVRAVGWPQLSQAAGFSIYALQPATPLRAQGIAGEQSDTMIRQIKPTGRCVRGGMGFGLGALIGGQFPKHPKSVPTQSR
jgi:hypothetical protein